MEISVYSVSRRPAFPALFPFPFRSFNDREVSSSRTPFVVVGGQKEKSKGRKEFNIKKLSFCVDMKIPRISASSDVCFLHSFLRICFAYIAVLFAFSTSTSASSSLRRQTLYRVLLLFGKIRRQQTNKVKRY